MLTFASDMIERLAIGRDEIRVGFVHYNFQARSEFFLSQSFSKLEIQNTINSLVNFQIPTNPGSNIAGAMREVLSNQLTPNRGYRPNVHSVVVMLTTGPSDIDRERTLRDAQSLHAAGVDVYTIGIGSALDFGELIGIASPAQGQRDNYWTVDGYFRLISVLEPVIEAMCLPPDGPPVPPIEPPRPPGKRVCLVQDINIVTANSTESYVLKMCVSIHFLCSVWIFNSRHRVCPRQFWQHSRCQPTKQGVRQLGLDREICC